MSGIMLNITCKGVFIYLILLFCLAGLPNEAGTISSKSQSQVQSKILNEKRDLLVHLPHDYENNQLTYPVLYVLDGEWIFDYAAGAVTFLSGDLAGRIPGMIVVGIPNTDRTRDLTVSSNTSGGVPGHVNFIKFIEEEVIPFVDKNYRTNRHKVFYGWSSGANICLWMLFTKPYLFDGYIASGTGIGKRTCQFAEKEFKKHSFKNKFLFANTEEETPIRVKGLNLLSGLLEKSAPEGLKWKCKVMKGDNHTAVLAKGLYAGLEFIYSDWKIPLDIAAKGGESVKSYYKELGKTYNFEITIPEGALSDAAVSLFQQDKVDKAIEILKLGLKEHPGSLNLYDSLGEIYELSGQLELALENFKIAVLKATEANHPKLKQFQGNRDRVREKIDDLEKKNAAPPEQNETQTNMPTVSYFSGLALEKNKTYKAVLVFNKVSNNWWPVQGLKIPFHHAAGISWINLEKFDVFSDTGNRVSATFRVVKVDIRKISDHREWTTEYSCDISGAVSVKSQE
ncbi:MAG: hypothetical protein GY940_47485 [bacterium]|nr:hypothetical protein [bacterium]